MDPLPVIKLGLILLGLWALYFVAWPLPNFLERVATERRLRRREEAGDPFFDYLAGEGERLVARPAAADDSASVELRIEAYAQARRISRAEAVRRLVEIGLAAEESRPAGEKVVAF